MTTDVLREPLLEAMRRRVARMSVGPSTARGQGVSGVVDRLRKGLFEIQLSAFATRSAEEFARALDKETVELQKRLPRQARSWGLARKCLNIFLRDCLYDRVLCGRFELLQCEHLLELPLDSKVAGRLRQEVGEAAPSWMSLRALNGAKSAAYQAAASQLAASWCIPRVHLDLYLYLDRP